jgi:hypothetical protein
LISAAHLLLRWRTIGRKDVFLAEHARRLRAHLLDQIRIARINRELRLQARTVPSLRHSCAAFSFLYAAAMSIKMKGGLL